MTKLTPADFSSAHISSRYAFGLSNESVAAGLRKLADDIAAGLYAVQEISMTEVMTREDFAMQTWNMKFLAARFEDKLIGQGK